MSRNISFFKKIPFKIIIFSLVPGKIRYQNIQLSYKTENLFSQFSGLQSIPQMSESFTPD